MKTLFFMLKYIKRNLKLWILGLLIPACASLATNVFYANRLQIYSTMITSSQPSLIAIGVMLAMTILVLLILSGIDDIGRYIFTLFSVSSENEMKHDFFCSLIHSQLKDLERVSRGELISRYNSDTVQSAGIVSGDIFGIIYPIIVGVGYLIAVLISDVWIGLIMFMLGLCVIIFNFIFLKKMSMLQKEILCANDEYVLNCSNAINGKMSIRQYSAKKMMSEKIKASSFKITQKESIAINLQTIKIITSDGMASMCIYLLTPLACVFAVYGYISVPVVLFIHQICRCFIMYTQNFATSFIQYNMHNVCLARIRSILDLPHEERLNGDDKKWGIPADSNISFKQVNVFYSGRHVLKNVSFDIYPGEIIGLIGESGSGKSTLTKALLQLVDYQGKISIGGVDCADIPLNVLRTFISISPEHSSLFNTTVYENIQFGNPNALKREILSIVNKLGIYDIEEFLQREAGEKGDKLSGGQKQKVSIARALLKNAPIIILDEPTAALDANSEAKVLNSILELKKEKKSVLLITHKASTLRIADRILQIENGEVVERSII